MSAFVIFLRRIVAVLWLRAENLNNAKENDLQHVAWSRYRLIKQTGHTHPFCQVELIEVFLFAVQ